MLQFLPKPILGVLALLLYVVNCLIVGSYILILAPFKYLLPTKMLRATIRRWLRLAAPFWTKLSNGIVFLISRTHFDVDIKGKISKASSYILISNHVSWIDIIALQKALVKIAPPSVYFMKRELLWLPLFGICCWLIDFPFMRRHSKEYLAKHPGQKEKDMNATRNTCKRYRKFPVTLVSYVEGTRYTLEKWTRQKSPYKHLLRPRGGGIAFSIAAMGNQVHELIDTTIVYPENDAYTFWDFLCGKVKRVSIYIRTIPITKDLIGNYSDDKNYREHFQAWLNKLWTSKDQLIEEQRYKSLQTIKNAAHQV